jgi:hypothetical protein
MDPELRRRATSLVWETLCFIILVATTITMYVVLP